MLQFLPIVERELRVASRHARTWWRRVLTTTAALALFTFFYLALGSWRIPSMIGRETFCALTVFGALFSLLAGPLATTDCLSRERREGTLGLLFLTHLRSHDVIVGKASAASLDLVFGLVAIIPVVALSLMLGGDDLLQVALVALALFDIMFLSLATGLFASAFTDSGRGALGLTVLTLLFLTLGLPLVGDNLFGLSFDNQHHSWFYLCCPLHGLQCCLEPRSGRLLLTFWPYWRTMLGLAGLAWALLAAASRRTRNAWRDLPASAREARWRERLAGWRQGGARFKLSWRRSMLERNPVAWLDGRDRMVEAALWSLLLLSMIFWAAAHLDRPRDFPDQETIVLWPVWNHYLLCVLIAIHAPRRLADDKQSGALELLLCTPVQTTEIVQGAMLVLRRRFGRALLAIMALDVFLAYAHYSEHGGWEEFLGRNQDTWQLALCALLVFPFQTWSMARVGLYQGLRQGSSLRATFMVVASLGVLPWLLFAACACAYELTAMRFPFWRRIEDPFLYGTWVALHLLVCGCFTARASWQLHRNFRMLATPGTQLSWWKRCFRFQQSCLTETASCPRTAPAWRSPP